MLRTVFSPGWLSRIVVCDEEAGAAAWTPLLNQTDRWSCAAACTAAHAGADRSFFRNSAQCLCAAEPEMEAVTVLLDQVPECFDDIFILGSEAEPESGQSQSQSGSWAYALEAEDQAWGYARGAWRRDSLDAAAGHRSAQLLHAKLVLVRYWVSEATACHHPVV